MDNYPYIIGGFPTLLLDFEPSNFKYQDVRDSIFPLLSKRDQKLVEWLEYGLKPKNLSHYFYYRIKSFKNHFLNEYFEFDKILRTLKVDYLQKREPSIEFDDIQEVTTILNMDNILLREQQYDKYIWEKVDQIVVMDILNIDLILAFLVKSKIVERWCTLDKSIGQQLLATLISEVRGTFKGVEFNEK